MQYAHDPALLLARFQFAFTVGVHIIFPAFSIGLAAYLAVLEGLWLKTGRPVFLDLPLLDQGILYCLRHGRGVGTGHVV